MKANLAYGSWREMRRRCYDKNRRDYRHYGGRGIEVCDRWQSFPDFLADMGDRPSRKHSIDRIDPDGNYCPENCRWATTIEQGGNKRDCGRNVKVTVRGVTYPTISAACRALGVSRNTVGHRIWRKGMSPEEALTRPVDYHGARNHS